ncbi:uncharacterized protein LOC119642453 [Glossina fuscipes]|uniref:Uncharacterized protein LOC119642453 n=1 Tax=Glossina fuscipes TaxID=7396 RepID=A0A9C5ZF85_9MUSC|nr:uncharacterized protein LOC119642453 [Glossina fuscipes]
MTHGLTTVPCVVGRVDIQSPVNVIDGIYTSEPSISAHARLIQEVYRLQARNEELQRRLGRYEGQEGGPETDSVVPDIGELKEVVKKLIPNDKIVQLHFDEVLTNHRVVYSRAEETLHGCKYFDERTKRKTCAHKTGPVFAVRRLMTAFNMLMSVLHTWEFRCKSTTTQSQTGAEDWIRGKN